jgi:hypothetical protein
MSAKFFFCALALVGFYITITNAGDRQAAIALTTCAGVFLILTFALMRDA